MNLTVYTKARDAKKDARGIVSEDAIGASKKVLMGVRKLELDFDRSVYRVEYDSPSGRIVAHGELNTLYEGDEMPDELFNFEADKKKVTK